MDKTKLLKKLFSEKTINYTFASLFFIIFSVFLLFIIRPSLTTAFSLKKEEDDLKKINAKYIDIISGIIDTQSRLENNRDKLFLIEKAIPIQPQVNKIASDIENAGIDNSIMVNKMNIQEITLIGENKNYLQSVKVNIEARSTFEDLINFSKDLFKQRRLKSIEKIVILKDNEASTKSSQLKFSIVVNGYYL